MSISKPSLAVAVNTLHKLKGVVQHYAWGGDTYLPDLLSVEDTGGHPYAEYWMGAHPKAPSQAQVQEGWVGLDQLIETSPEAWLGEEVARRFDKRLPFLFKVLEVKDMLSIQVHPTKGEAEKGFAHENSLGVPLGAPHRNYKDDNHKPEIMVALTDFWLLHGFKPVSRIRETLEQVPELSGLVAYLDAGGIQALYPYLMELPQAEVNAQLRGLIHRIGPQYTSGALPKDSPHFWAARAAAHSPLPAGDIDRGIYSIYLFNLVNIPRGKGIFQGAGIPHAYLEGVNVELMANSDNVLRGGLTPKHIDVPELLRHVSFDPVIPEILAGVEMLPGEYLYPSPAPDFMLSHLDLSQGKPYRSTDTHSLDICVVIDGAVLARAGDDKLHLERGEVLMAPAGLVYELAGEPRASLYKASVPVN